MLTFDNETSLWNTIVHPLLICVTKRSKGPDLEDLAESPGGIVLIVVVCLLLLAVILIAIIVPIVCIRRKRQVASYQAMATPSGVVRRSRHPITIGAPVSNPDHASNPMYAPTVTPSTVNVGSTVWAQPLNPTVRASEVNAGQTAALFPPAATKVGV